MVTLAVQFSTFLKFTNCLMMPGLCYVKICPLKDFILLKQGGAEEDIHLFRFSLGRLERGLGGWRNKQEIGDTLKNKTKTRLDTD